MFVYDEICDAIELDEVPFCPDHGAARTLTESAGPAALGLLAARADRDADGSPGADVRSRPRTLVLLLGQAPIIALLIAQLNPAHLLVRRVGERAATESALAAGAVA